MQVTKQMIDDVFNAITAALKIVATIPPDAKTLTTSQMAVDVLSKTFASLQTDIEKYFIQPSSTEALAQVSPEIQEQLISQVNQIAAAAAPSNNSKAETFEKVWSLAQPLLDLVVSTATANLPKGSTAIYAIITTVDAVLAMGDALAKDLPLLATQPTLETA